MKKIQGFFIIWQISFLLIIWGAWGIINCVWGNNKYLDNREAWPIKKVLKLFKHKSLN